MYLAMGEQDLETPLLGAFEQPSRVWNFFSSFWSGNNAEPVLIVPPEAVEMGSINELPVSTQRLFQAASEDLPVELYVPPSPLGEGIHPVQIAQVESATDAIENSVEMVQFTSVALSPLTEEVTQVPWGQSVFDSVPDWENMATFETTAWTHP